MFQNSHKSSFPGGRERNTAVSFYSRYYLEITEDFLDCWEVARGKEHCFSIF